MDFFFHPFSFGFKGASSQPITFFYLLLRILSNLHCPNFLQSQLLSSGTLFGCSLLSKIVFRQQYRCVKDNKSLPSVQSGFRSGHSYSTFLTHITRME